jgi:hypothetical protein
MSRVEAMVSIFGEAAGRPTAMKTENLEQHAKDDRGERIYLVPCACCPVLPCGP